MASQSNFALRYGLGGAEHPAPPTPPAPPKKESKDDNTKGAPLDDPFIDSKGQPPAPVLNDNEREANLRRQEATSKQRAEAFGRQIRANPTVDHRTREVQIALQRAQAEQAVRDHEREQAQAQAKAKALALALRLNHQRQAEVPRQQRGQQRETQVGRGPEPHPGTQRQTPDSSGAIPGRCQSLPTIDHVEAQQAMLLQQQIARSESTYPRACAPAQTVNRQAGISNGSEQPQLAPQQPQAALEQARQDRQAIYQRIESAKQQARATRERNIRDRAIREQAQVTREQATIRDQAIRDQAIRDQATRGQQTPASVHQPSPNSRPHNPPSATAAFLDHTSATRISTDTVIARALKAQYPSLELTIVAEHNCQLLAYAAAGHAVATPVADSDAAPASLSWKLYAPPARRLDGGVGALGEQPIFSKYVYRWAGHEFIVYFVDGRDGSASYPQIRNYYVLSPEPHLADRLVMEAGKWSDDLHEEILIFDQGTWQKSKELYASIRDARWENVILDEGMKKAVIEDHLSFFRSRDTYTGLKVPWKRGIIYYGPPGNGKTISIKATMNMLYRQTPEIPTLYVRTLTSWAGPEFSVRQIFAQARRYAPCYLVFEDLDTIVSDSVRSYFLNEVDGLKNNDGIFMVGSTNHLDRLDPGISKRPSRFDRKYYFPDPDLEQRIAYCHFWQKKLGDNDEIKFPDKLCKAIAEITDKFSFAYMQEAFVAALLSIASKSDSPGHRAANPEDGEDEWVGVTADADDDFDDDDNSDDDDDDDDDSDDLEQYILWVEIKKQVAILREGMDDKS